MPPRPRKTEATRQTQQTLSEAAVYGAKLIRDILRGTTTRKGATGTTLVKMGRVSGAKLAAAKIAIDHAIGLPKAKIELKTDAMTMKDIAELAQAFGENGDENNDVVVVPTKPLTKRQLKERSKN